MCRPPPPLHTPGPVPCPQFPETPRLGQGPQTPSPPPPLPLGLALPMATSLGTQGGGDPVTLPGYFGEDKSGGQQVWGHGSRRRGGE